MATKKAPSVGKTAPSKTTAAKKTGDKAVAKKSDTPVAGRAKRIKTPSPFSQEFLESQRQLLLSERAKYLRSADSLRAEADSLVAEREPGDVQFDEESGEGDTLAVERERDLALSAQAKAQVEAIDAALGRIEAGTYGICIHSGEPIPEERLEAIPWAVERVEFKTGIL